MAVERSGHRGCAGAAVFVSKHGHGSVGPCLPCGGAMCWHAHDALCMKSFPSFIRPHRALCFCEWSELKLCPEDS